MAERKRPSDDRGRLARVGNLSWGLIEIAAGWAETSARLTDAEREQLKRLRTKARDQGTPLGPSERATYVSLVVKAVGVDRMRRLIRDGNAPALPPPRDTRAVDAAERLERAAQLRDAGVITEDDFATLKARYLDEL